MSETFLDMLVRALREAAQHDSHDSAKRIAVLWTDPEEEWRPILGALRHRIPLLTLGGPGEYDPASLTGPAYYLRCLVARTLPGVPEGEVPVIYLRGVSRAAVRVREECPKAVLPLVELQYRGSFFCARKTTDWTITAFLQSEVGVAIAGDGGTREAVLRSLVRLAEQPLARLRKEAPLRAEWFDRLHHPDPARAILDWLSDPERFKADRKEDGWAAFRSLLRSLFDLDPETQKEVTGARRLAERRENWKPVWDRFAEHPEDWPGLPERLRVARPQTGLLDRVSAPDRWPQDNEAAEDHLRSALADLTIEKPGPAREAVLKLEAQHGPRRDSVWAKLGKTPLAAALAPLAVIAGGTQKALTGDIAGLASAWTSEGWKVDLAALDARACIDAPPDEAAVRAAVRAMYLPWLDTTATIFQKAVATEGWQAPSPIEWGPGVCVLFSDGLRYDVAQRLTEILRADGLEVGVGTRRGALPGLTETAKPALMPIADKLRAAAGFDVSLTTSTSPRASTDALRVAMERAGICLLGDGVGDTSKPGWTECGDVDHRGHDLGWGLGRELNGLLQKIAHRIRVLVDAGWTEVRVVTDHGWLAVPGELGKPPDVLPEHLSEVRKGRCARMKPNSQTVEQTVPWHFDPQVRVAVAPGASCYEAGKGYEHGGLSPQECILPVLTVRGNVPKSALSIVKIGWRSLRLSVEIEGAPEGATLDVRGEPGDDVSWIGGAQRVGPDGHATGLVHDDRRLGVAAWVVVLSGTTLLAQRETKVGER